MATALSGVGRGPERDVLVVTAEPAAGDAHAAAWRVGYHLDCEADWMVRGDVERLGA